MIYIGSIFQLIGLLFFLLFSVGAGSLGLYTVLTGEPSATTELGNFITVLSFFGAFPLGILGLGFIFVKRATGGSYFSNAVMETVGKLVIVPISIALSVSFAVIVVPLLIYRYYQYKNGIETGTIQFIKWATKSWYTTLPIYIGLVLCLLFVIM